MAEKRKFGVFLGPLMIAVGILMSYPAIMMMIVSLKDNMPLANESLSSKTSSALENYETAIDEMGYWRALMNSTTLTVNSALLTALFGAYGAYAITWVKRGRKLFIALNISLLVGFTLPKQVAMVLLVLWMQKLDVGNTLFELILAFIGASVAYGIFLFNGFVNAVPVTLEEAAFIGSVGGMETFLTIVLLLSKPPAVTPLTVIALRVWNNFIYPLLLFQDKNSRTLPFIVFFFKGDLPIQWNILFAATTLVILPLLTVYFLLQKQIISGMLSGSVRS